MSDYTLPRNERLRSLKAVRRLFMGGKGGFVYPFRYVFLAERGGAPAETGAAAAEDAAMNRGADGIGVQGAVGKTPAETGVAAAEDSVKNRAADSAAADSAAAALPAAVPCAEGVHARAGSIEVLFSVPKKYHKRANRRNLLRRRTKEAYRLNRGALREAVREAGVDLDMALIYSAKEIQSYKSIENAVRRILEKVRARV